MQITDSTDVSPSEPQLAALTTAVRDISRRARLSPDDASDFSQTVHLHLLERNYRPIRQFSGRSSLETYLRVVVGRILLDWQRTQHGKWRTSAAARRLGREAVALERLIYRAGHPLEEAIQILKTAGTTSTDTTLRHVAMQLPSRHWRRHVPIDERCPPGVVDFVDPVDAAQSRRTNHARRRRLAAALRGLPARDRQLLDMRYRRRMPMSAIGTALNDDPKALYRRCDRVLRALRKALETECRGPERGAFAAVTPVSTVLRLKG